MGTRVVGQTINLQKKAETEDSKYITQIDSHGIRVHPASETSDTTSIQLDGTGLDIKKGGLSIAMYGESTRIGKEKEQHLAIDDSNLFFHNSKGDIVGAISQTDGDKHYWFTEDSLLYYDGNTGDSSSLSYYDNKVTYVNGIVGPGGSLEDEFVDTVSKVNIKVIIAGLVGTCTLTTNAENTSNERTFTVGSLTLTASITTKANRGSITISIGSIDSTIINNTRVEVTGYSYLITAPRTTVSFGNHGSVLSRGNSFSFGHYAEAGGDDHVALGYYTNTEPLDPGAGGTLIALGRCNDIPTKFALLVVGNGDVSSYGLINKQNALELYEDGDMTITGALQQGSDRRLKEHIAYLNETEKAKQFVHNLKPAYFKKSNQLHLGFYAQDIEEIDDWHCLTGEMNGFKTLNYVEIIAPLVTYCQSLEKDIVELKEHINELEGK